MPRARARTEGLLIMTRTQMHFLVSRRGKCIQPAGACGKIQRTAPETHARSGKQRTFRVESFLHRGVRLLSRSCSHDADNDQDENGQDDEDDNGEAAGTTTNKTTDEGSFGKSHRDTSRAKILPGIHPGPSSSGVSEGRARRYDLSRWVTQGSTAPGGAL